MGLLLAGCYETVGGDPDDTGGIASGEPEPEPTEPDGVSGVGSELVGGTCLPRSPSDETWFGCVDEPGSCVTTPDRLRVEEDGTMVFSFAPHCAQEYAHGIEELLLDGAPVPPTQIVWEIELRLPAEAPAGGGVDLGSTPGAAFTFRSREKVQLEAEDCGHDPWVYENHEGDRHPYCRMEWTTFTARAGDDPGFFLRSEARLVADGFEEGDRIALGLSLAGCGEALSMILSEDAEPLLTACCAPYDADLAWTVGSGGVLLGRPFTYIRERCCARPAQVDECTG